MLIHKRGTKPGGKEIKSYLVWITWSFHSAHSVIHVFTSKCIGMHLDRFFLNFDEKKPGLENIKQSTLIPPF